MANEVYKKGEIGTDQVEEVEYLKRRNELQKEKNTKILSVVLFFIATVAAMSLYFFYQVFKPIDVLKVHSVKLDKEAYRPGENLILTVNYSKGTDVLGVHTITFLCHRILPSYSTKLFLPTGENLEYQYELSVPLTARPGRCKIDVEVEYEPNNFQKKKYQIVSPEFPII